MYSVYKPVGITPLQAIERLKHRNPELAAKTISYAGRLDPMAEGLLLLLVNEENKNRNYFEAMQKTYEFSVLLGIATDTYDILGIITNAETPMRNNTVYNQQIAAVLQSFLGKHMQEYPPYSSKTVQGKPLYWWAREKRLVEIDIPSKLIEISDIALLSAERITRDDLESTIVKRIQAVSGNFRQTEILRHWNSFFRHAAEKKQTDYTVLNCRVTCSSGTYVRSIAHEVGIKRGCGALALQIKRTQIGTYTLEDAIKV